ncbi:MAG: FAD-dependent oxidoreductase [Bacteroidales bacterium]|jgi:glycine/D-amino acid oxidase-like deaminating enzyme/Fe-S-cluster-containing hydrogenase component 2|nr:FAD-dependent oxidoreductase [Bacteroidales bacterium]
MQKIEKHPILNVPETEKKEFKFNGKTIIGNKGFTVAAALHQAGYPVHSHSLDDRNRSLECGIGKCGACEMLVDGNIRRICITKVDNVNEVSEITSGFLPEKKEINSDKSISVYKTDVAIIGAGPAGLAARELLNKYGVSNIVVDNNDKIGGQFLMQTHQFFFFEKEKKFGGMRGFEIAETLAGENRDGIMLNCVVWDILEGKKLAVKNIDTNEIFYVKTDHLIVATGAIPFMPAFKNDDVPGVYTAAVVQKMMNNEFTLLGKKVLTIGAGNIGYLTSYQLMQAGAEVKAIIEAAPHEGGFPVQANRVRRLGIPVITKHTLIEAIPNDDYSGVIGAVIAECENFKPIPGTEKTITGIDAINICTGLVPDDQLMIKGVLLFGRDAHSVGDASRIGEGTSAVLRGKQAAYEILENLGVRYHYNDYLSISKEYIDSQQHPVRVIKDPFLPSRERAESKPYVLIDCLYGFACNPCEFACPHNAITKTSTSTVPHIDYEKCVGCMDCVYQCPGLAMFGYNEKKDWLFLPIEYEAKEGQEVYLVDNNGKKLGEGVIEKILFKPNKTNVARVKSKDLHGENLTKARGFVIKENYPEPLILNHLDGEIKSETYICHCDDVKLEDILKTIGDRKFISIDEVKHTTRLGMGACRGKRCIKRLKQAIAPYGIEIIGDATPRAPLSSQVNMGDLFPHEKENTYTNIHKKANKRIKVQTLIAGGGMAGSSLFRFMAEAGMSPVLLNKERGSSWRNIAGGRPAFSLPALADIALKNRELFVELQKISNIDYKPIRYISFAHDDATYKALDVSRAWSDAFMVDKKDFIKEISPYFNPRIQTYKAALVTNDCWQATPGKTIDLLRRIGISKGGSVLEDCELVDVQKDKNNFIILVRDHNKEYLEYECEHFINALGAEAGIFADKLGIETGLYPVKHQAFITRRLPFLGKNGVNLDMLIDRRKYKGFSAVYGQQLAETGQIIGCASPLVDPMETDKDLSISSKEFLEIVSEVFVDWIPRLSDVGFQAVWSGYYVEPRYIVDPENGLFIGMRGHGFMLCQYLAKLYTDSLMGRPVPDYFNELKLSGAGLSEAAFK